MRRVACTNNLKTITAALHSYHDDHGSFPPASISDAQGTPIHSWRILLLPYLDHQDLYDAYRFDEPWDGPNNRRLVPRMPEIYACPSHGHHGEPAGEFVSNYLAVVGSNTLMNADWSYSISDYSDGLNVAILVVDANRHSVNWMSPADCTTTEVLEMLDSAEASNHPEMINVAFADGSVDTVTHATMRFGADDWLADQTSSRRNNDAD